MHASGVLLLVTLSTGAGAPRDGGIPPWLPRPERGDVEDSATYGLRKWGLGYLWENQWFEARVAPDGVVTFKDKHGSMAAGLFGFKLYSKNEVRRDRRPGVGASSYPPGALSGQGQTWHPAPGAPAPEANERTIDQTIRCPEFSGCETLPQDHMIPMIWINGTFDLTDEILRSFGKDPYRLEKARFLSATFEFRIKLAIEARKRYLRESLDRLPRALDELWADDRYSFRERRRLLYELWSEMDDTPEGERAARMIQDFVGRRLPCGDPDGFSPEERRGWAKTRGARTFLDPHGCGKKE
jgi:hypothetical protein